MTAPVVAALDIQALQVDGFADRGIGRYVASYAAALAKASRVAGALLAPELPPPAGLPGELVSAGLVHWDSAEAARQLGSLGRCVAYHVTAPFLHTGARDVASLALAPHWARTGLPRVTILYDLIPLRAPRHYLATPSDEERYLARARWVAASDLILTISEHTRGEAIELLGCDPGRAVTIGAGISTYFSAADGTDEELWRHRFEALNRRPFVLTVSGSDARKNTERLIAALGRLASRGCDMHLVVVGHLTPAWRAQLNDAARRAGVGQRVILTGHIGDELLRACYRRAALTVVPSLAEGAGLPALESAASGTPALVSSTTALAEVAGSPLATFDPTDTEAIADSIARAVADDTRRKHIVAAQRALAAASTWASVAHRAGAALDHLGQALPAAAWAPPPAPRQLALVGPMPPAGGGIGTYNERLVASMTGRVEVTAVTASLSGAPQAGRARWASTWSFGKDVRPASYDAVVYTLGNSSGHLPTVELALRHPGWLWLHEVRLPAIATTALDGLDDDQYASAMEWLLNRAYPGRPPLRAARRAGRSNLDLIAAGVGLVPLLAERCRGLLVNSELARRVAILDLAPLAHHPPVRVLPPACPPVRARRPSPVERSDPLVVSLGMVSMAKRPDLAVDAAAVAGCRLAFIGPCPPILAQVIGDRARIRGISDRVQVIGAVDDGRWRQSIDAASLAVQLRDAASGETSASLLEALAAGLPALTNIPSAKEYPEGTVSFVPTTEPSVVGTRIAALLDSPAQRAALTEAGQAFASEHQFGRLARELVAAVSG